MAKLKLKLIIFVLLNLIQNCLVNADLEDEVTVATGKNGDGDVDSNSNSNDIQEKDNSEDVVNESKKQNNNREDYYTSLVGVQNLVKKEQEIVRKLKWYRQKLKERIELTEFFLDEYQEDIKSMKKYFRDKKQKYPTISVDVDDDQDLNAFAEEVSANPLRVFKLIRRFHNELRFVSNGLQSETSDSEIKSYFDELGTTFNLPTKTDLKGAADGLLRVQLTYQLPTFHMVNGILIDKKTKTVLSAFDAQFIATRAYDDELFATALEWLYASYQKILKQNDFIALHNIKNDLKTAVERHNKELLQFRPLLHRDLFNNLVNSNYSNIPELHVPPAIWDYQYGTPVDSIYDLYNFHGLCRGEKLLTPKEEKNLRCWYSRSHSPYNILSPLKFEMLHESPVIQVYDLLNDEIISHLKQKAFSRLRRAKIVGSEETGRTSDTRTSAVAWIMDYFGHPLADEIVEKVPKIIKRVTGLEDGRFSAAEELQISCYGGVGGFYIPHFDALSDPRIPHNESFEASTDYWRGDRVTTVMFYLSDVELGGGTAFPRMGIAARPVKGSAVMWNNLRRSGERDLMTLHGGCPVLYGNKWVANKWIRLNDQFHVRKCTKNMNE